MPRTRSIGCWIWTKCVTQRCNCYFAGGIRFNPSNLKALGFTEPANWVKYGVMFGTASNNSIAPWIFSPLIPGNSLNCNVVRFRTTCRENYFGRAATQVNKAQPVACHRNTLKRARNLRASNDTYLGL